MIAASSDLPGRGISAEVVITHGLDGLPPLIACGVLVSAAERDWMDAVRFRSYELAVQRGHIVRYP